MLAYVTGVIFLTRMQRTLHTLVCCNQILRRAYSTERNYSRKRFYLGLRGRRVRLPGERYLWVDLDRKQQNAISNSTQPAGAAFNTVTAAAPVGTTHSGPPTTLGGNNRDYTQTRTPLANCIFAHSENCDVIIMTRKDGQGHRQQARLGS